MIGRLLAALTEAAFAGDVSGPEQAVAAARELLASGEVTASGGTRAVER